MFLALKRMRQITISTYICIANKERRLVVKPVHLNFNYWKRTIENERPAVQRVSCFVYTICKCCFCGNPLNGENTGIRNSLYFLMT